MTQLAFGTLQGKLVPATRRGRLMLFGNVGGAAVAIAAAWLLLPLWLDTGDGQFHFIFVISAIFFSVAAVIGWQLAEGRDATRGESKKMKVTSSWEILRGDRSFRRASFLAFLFGTSFVLFPHYQALARVRLQIDFSDLVFWVIVQNAGTAVVSLVAGFIADARGNRIVLRFLLFGLFLLPTFSLFLSYDLHWGRSIFWGIFLGKSGDYVSGLELVPDFRNLARRISQKEFPRKLFWGDRRYRSVSWARPQTRPVVTIRGIVVIFHRHGDDSRRTSRPA